MKFRYCNNPRVNLYTRNANVQMQVTVGSKKLQLCLKGAEFSKYIYDAILRVMIRLMYPPYSKQHAGYGDTLPGGD